MLKEGLDEAVVPKELFTELAIGIETIIHMHKIRDWHSNKDVENRMLNDIDDLVHNLSEQHGIRIKWGDIKEPLDKIMSIAKHRDKHG